MIKSISLILGVLLLIIFSNYYISTKQPNNSTTQSVMVEYTNNAYGFRVALPQGWKGYSIVDKSWEGVSVGSNAVTEYGPLVSIRHPLWTADVPRQDIPVMVFTLQQWNDLQADKFHIGAAPIGPRELGRNTRYVFALPARYNFAYLPGFEEVDQIINSNAFSAFSY